MTRCFDDVAVGDTFESRGMEDVTREGILDFARAWDPQTYHIDEEVAKRSFAGGLPASAIHTFKPVLAGDRMRVRVTITAMRPSKSHPRAGIITNRTELINQTEEVVLCWSLSELVNLRPRM